MQVRAARWFEENGLIVDAARHFAAARDWTGACAAVVRRLGLVALLEGRASTELTEIFAHLPGSPDLDGSAMIGVVRAAQAVDRADLPAAAAFLDHAEAAVATEKPADHAVLRAACALTRVVLARASLDAPAAETAWAELDLQLSLVPAVAAEHPDARALALSCLAGTQLWTGDFVTAERTANLALVAAASEGCEYPRLLALGKLALFAYRNGLLHDAARYGSQALQLAEDAGLPARHRTGVGHLALSMVALEWNDRAAFDVHLDAAAGTTDAARDPVVRATVGMMLAFRMGVDGHRAEALAALADLPTSVGGRELPSWLSSRIALTTAGVQLRCGAPDVALAALERATVRGTEWHLVAASAHCAAGDAPAAQRLIDPILGADDPVIENGAVDAAVLAARLRLDAGDLPAARRYLMQAMDIARPEARRRPFVEGRSWLWPLIRETPDLVRAASWIGPALTARHDSRSLDHSDIAPALVEPLTDRERTVLGRMALAMSVADIAADLHVSMNTVKTHQKSLYRKLSVQRSNDAVRRGRQLQII